MARSSLAGDGMFVGALVSGRLGAACSGAIGEQRWPARRQPARPAGWRAGVPSMADWLAPAIWGVWALGGLRLLALGGQLECRDPRDQPPQTLAGNGLNGLGRPARSAAVKPGVRDAIKPRNQPHCGATLDNDRGTH